MGFASHWLEKNALFPAAIKEAPDDRTGIIIVVPAYNEPGIESLLDSLKTCTEPDCRTEVIIVVNAPADPSDKVLSNNKLCIKNIESWKKANKGYFFRLYVIDTGEHGIQDWGVGLSRKSGMDEATRRFDAIGNPQGTIVNLDADCTVKSNYFTEICKTLVKNKERKACSVYFEHPLSGGSFNDRIYKLIALYELHLRYYLQCLIFTGFPYAFHTVGSAMACKTDHYIKAGGMNRKQAGEDFYFIQKLVQLGGYFTLNSTIVYPSPRESLRVPFGTGATMNRMISNREEDLMTYSIDAFKELQILFRNVTDYFHASPEELADSWHAFPAGIRSFMDEKEWIDKIAEIQRNTSGELSFRKRFFGWFNMFRIVKYLNNVHSCIYEKQPVVRAASELLSVLAKECRTRDTRELLLFFREMELEK